MQVNIFRKKKDNTVLFIYTITAVHLLRGFDLLQIGDNYVVAWKPDLATGGWHWPRMWRPVVEPNPLASCDLFMKELFINKSQEAKGF